MAHKENPAIKRRQASIWSARNKEKLALRARKDRKLRPDAHKQYQLKNAFGITLHEYNEMLAAQNGLCAICQRPETAKHQSGKTKSLAVDHCHATLKIRGLLCWACNTGIGKLRHDIALLRKSIAYLSEEPA